MFDKIWDFLSKNKVEKILSLLSFLLFLSSFVKSIGPLVFNETPNYFRLFIGLILTLFFILSLTTDFFSIQYRPRFSLKDVLTLKFSDLITEIKIGAIESILADEELPFTIVLPANCSLDDQCINDDKSALGAFVLKRIPSQKEKFLNELKAFKELQKDEVLDVGTSFMLNDNFSLNHKIMITCVSVIKEKKGVISYPENIPICVKKIFEVASENKIKHIVTPIIGSGHGGINISEALHLFLLSASFYSKSNHHIKKLTILIHPSKQDAITNDICIFNKKIKS